MSNEIKVEEGPKREFSTGAKKQASTGKGTPVLVPGDAVIEVSKHFENGAVVHGDRNWEKGIPLSELLNSLERHLQQEKMGVTDEPHARALAWNALVYLATKLRIENGLLPAELDDMPSYKSVEKGLMEVDYAEMEVKAIAVAAKKMVEEGPAEDEERSCISADLDGKLYCHFNSCYNRGFPKKESIFYYCPEHPKKETKDE